MTMAKLEVQEHRVVHVSSRSVGAFREVLGRDWIVKSDRDIRDRLLEDLRALTPKWTVTDIHAPHEPTAVFELAAPGGIRYAVVRDETVITMLSEDQVARNLKGNWIPAGSTTAAAAPPPDEASDLEAIVSTLSGAEVRAALALAEAEKNVARRRATVAAEQFKVAEMETGLAAAQRELALAEKLRDQRLAELADAVRADAKV